MSEPQAYPVYFDSEALDDEKLKKIQMYFKIRRKSGGGECSAITNVSDKVYRVDFKDKEDQQRVLMKREHRVEIAGVTLVLTVRDTVQDTVRDTVRDTVQDTVQDTAGSTAAPPGTAPGSSPTQEASAASPHVE